MFVNLFDCLIGAHPTICKVHAKTKNSANLSHKSDKLTE